MPPDLRFRKKIDETKKNTQRLELHFKLKTAIKYSRKTEAEMLKKALLALDANPPLQYMDKPLPMKQTRTIHPKGEVKK